MRKGFLIGLAGIGVVVALVFRVAPTALSSLESWMLTPQGCLSSCKGDLGDMKVEGFGNGFIPRCQPAELRLELHSLRVKRGVRFPLWHRLMLKNTSCFAIEDVFINGLIERPGFTVVRLHDGEVVERSAPNMGRCQPLLI